MNFATLPPEINSGRMYAGPGSGSMTEAATAWERLATRLRTTVADYRAVIAELAATWEGPAATAMTRAAARYVDWLNTVAARAELAATLVAAMVSAHETALAAMVPPPVIEANRTQRRSLALTNCLGQASPAIADTEADYEEMWAQDCDAMYGYADASANASTVPPFTSPPIAATRALGTWALTAAPDVISAGSQVMSTIPEALQALCASPPTTWEAALSSVTSFLSKLSSLSAPADFAISHLNGLNKAAALRSLVANPGSAGGAAVIARFGRATSIATSMASLSVPQAWTNATPSPADLLPGWVCEPIHLVRASEPPS
jgi:PPE-repeat protein